MKEIKKSANIKSKVKGKDVKFNIDLNYSPEYDSFNIKVKKGEGFMSYTDALQGLPLEVVENLNEMLEEVLIKSGSKTEMKEHKMSNGGNFQSGVYANGGFVDWKKYPTKNVIGLYEIKGDGINSKVNIVFFERYDDDLYSLYPLDKDKNLFREILVKSTVLNSLDKGVSVQGETNEGKKVSIKRISNQDFSYADGGALIGNQKRIDLNHNGKIDAEDFKLLRTTMNGGWRKDHKYLNSSEDYEVIYARKYKPSRKGYKGKTNFATGGGVDRFSEYSNDALYDMIINLSRYENTESEIQMVKAELEKRKANQKMATGGGIGIEEEIDLTDDKKLRLRKPVMPERKYSEREWAEKFNPRAYEYMGKRKMATGGSLPSGSINALGDLWFAVQQKDTDDYKMLSNNLDKLKVPFAIQNEVSADAETQRGRKALNISEVHDRIKKIVEKNNRKFAKGGKTEQGVDLFEDYENIPPKLQAILEKYEDAFEDGDYRGLQKALEEANKIGYTFEYYLDGQAYDLRKIGEKGKSEVEEYANGGGVEKLSFEDWLKKNNIEVYKRTYYWVADDGGSDYMYSGSKGEVMKSLREDYKKSFANGGAFQKLSDKVAKNYEGKRVKPQYQKEYGKVYSKSEAKEVGDKVAGKVKANQKMATGGETKKGAKGGIMVLAKKIRKEGESWQDALKRAGQQLK